MAVVIMGSANDKNGADPVFHDFLGMSCGEAPPAVWARVRAGGRAVEVPEASVSVSASAASAGASSGGQGLVSGGSDLASGPEVNNQLLGRKRSNSDSAFMGGLLRERGLSMAWDSPESSRMLKMPPKEVMSERHGRPHDDIVFTTQSSPRPASLAVHPHVTGRPDFVTSRWEQTTPLSSGSMLHYTSRFGQSAMQVDKPSPCSYKESSTAIPLVSQAAADEGSRTGIKGAGILNVITSGGGSGERKTAGTLPCNTRMTAIPQITEPESSNMLSRHGISTTSRQMTIFYAGQAHVFDDVHPNKADVIMALAGSDGGSWSTAFSAKSTVRPTGIEAKLPGVEKELVASNVPFSQDPNARLPLQGNPSHGGFGQLPRVPLLGDASILTPGGRAVRDVRPTKAVETDAEPKRNV